MLKLAVPGCLGAIIGVTVVAAVVTPPDAISMLSLMLPMVALYEVSIWLARLIEKKRDEAAEAEDEASGTDVTPA